MQDRGWLATEQITALIGTNESGKTNIMLPLWKLSPAADGQIDLQDDLPRDKYHIYRNAPQKPIFIRAQYALSTEEQAELAEIIQCDVVAVSEVIISRDFDGNYTYEFPNEPTHETEDDAFVSIDGVTEFIDSHMPKYVYYSNYGNLDSQIYLPQVLQNMNKTDLGVKEAAKARTLKTLFKYVNLDPKEITEMGTETNGTPNAAQIDATAKKKKEREILLSSAAAGFTKSFNEWWKQGDYTFDFKADGNYFRIWVSDHVRTDEVGLELRSTGLQWFLSFYLIFLVESQNQHKNAILLLDEAGLTLHPLAQKDLALFFENLATNNQIINTTHSPFIVDTANIDRCRVVYVDSNGYTVASSNLRQGADALNERSIYAVHAAMGLSVSDIMLQGCQPIVVEGPSDQHYLNAIKAFLIREKFIAPKQEMVFIPSGGVKGVPGVVSIACGKSEQLPYVLLDSDSSGTGAKGKLQSGLYRDNTTKILSVSSFCDVDRCEVEDLIPFALLDRGITRLFLTVEDYSFVDDYDATKPIIPQIESFAARHNVSIPEGWKVDLAKSVKQALRTKSVENINAQYLEMWKKLFETLNN